MGSTFELASDASTEIIEDPEEQEPNRNEQVPLCGSLEGQRREVKKKRKADPLSDYFQQKLKREKEDSELKRQMWKEEKELREKEVSAINALALAISRNLNE